MENKVMNIDIGLKEQSRVQVAEGLKKILADSYILYLKTQNFHWNVTGPMFPSLHVLFENQYRALAEAADALAERIRALGARAPGSFYEFSQLSEIKEATGKLNAREMLLQLEEDHEKIVKRLRAVIPVAEETSDDGTLDLLTERMREHEKAAWMIRASVMD